MLSENRQHQIMEIIVKKGSVTVTELSETLETSESTIRRDLNELDDKGLLKKVFGGAVLKSVSFESSDIEVESRASQNHSAKEIIAKTAASMIKDGDFVYLDAGTTTELMIPYINAKNVVFVTNGFVHAKKLSLFGFKTFILGGEIKISTEAVIGTEVIRQLEKYNFTKGFFGVNGISISSGLTTPDIREANIKEKAFQHCLEKIVLADSTKFSQISCVRFASFEDAKIITDKIDGVEFSNCNNILEAK